MMKYYLVAGLAIACACPYMAAGYAKDTTKKTKGLDEVTVSASRNTQSRRMVAQQVQLLEREQIVNAQAQTSADLLANTMGLFVQKSQAGGGSPVLRGFEANKVLLVVDGVRMNNIMYRGGHLQNVITLDNAALDRVEVLYGPSSTVYGSDALGGVIHFYTKQPQFSVDTGKTLVKSNAYVRYGSVNNEKTGHADVSIGGRRFASLTSVTASSFGDMRGGASQNPFYNSNYGERPTYVERINGKDSLVANSDKYLQVQSGYSQVDVMQKFAYRQNEKVTHLLNLQLSTSTDIPRYDRLTDPSATTGLRYAQWYYGPQQRVLASYNVNRTDESEFFQRRHVGIHYQDIVESRHNRSFGSNRISHRKEDAAVMGANIDMEHTGGRHTLALGLEYQANALTSKAEQENIVTSITVPIDTRYPDGTNTMDNYAVYHTHTMRIDDKWTLNDGVRLGFSGLRSTLRDTSILHLPFTEAKQTHFVYSGNAAIIHTPTDKWKLSAMVSTGFRVPNVDDLAKVFESAPGTLIVPNANLRPEQTVNSELGITKVFGGCTTWENALYYTRFFDAIITAPFTFNGQDSVIYDGVKSRVMANQNMQNAHIYGLWSYLRSQVTDRLLLGASASYTYGRILTGSADAPLDHIPPLMLRAQATYTIRKWTFDGFVNYQAEKPLSQYYLNGEDNEQYATPTGMPAWMTANLRVVYRVHKYITLQAGIDNILDTQYRVFASGINGAGRNIFGVVRFHY
ncbi:MAG: TonB-dependent receptor [Taibaiella sp.]|nr:TonB-dependent receptor [Taibaiella sp.]